MWSDVSDATTRLAIRRLFAIYLIVSAIALLFPHRPASWPVLLLLHAVIAMLLLKRDSFKRFAQSKPGRIIGDWYLLILIPLLYTELAPLNFSIFNGHYFDSIIIGWEKRIFGGMPSHDLAQRFPFLPLSEFFHFSYISYYLIIYGPAFYLYLKGKREDHQRLVFNIMLAFFAHYVFFIYFPVQGPRYLFPAPGGKLADGFFYQTAHKILESGSSRGAAFPSSHVGVSFAQSAFVFLTAPRIAPVVLLLSAGLALGAVYGGFHYGTDALCGLLYGLALFALAPRVVRWLGRSA